MAQPSMRLATYAERNLGYDRRQLRDAAGNLGVFITNIDGKPHWQRPDNVVAMWWNKPAQYSPPKKKAGGAA
jgi:hypothetical protein